ncbi:MAG: B12-binding domain-containing radical SAM protein [Planctomycetes bacterium]|nr:B12-binding domain-containing radical SAM protein [Planctomycetota bacterium]
MRVLLFSMPDTMPNFRGGLNRWPSLALCSLAASAPEHEVVVADLCCRRDDVPGAVKEALTEVRPDVVGVSAMSFQFYTACGVARIVRKHDPQIKVMGGGYHVMLLAEEIAKSEDEGLFDFLVRGEGERTFPKLLHALAHKKNDSRFDDIPGLSFRANGHWVHNSRSRDNLDLSAIRPPNRSTRFWSSYRIFFQGLDLVETSRGCTMPCNFCCIRRMYGKTYREYPLERVIADIADAKKHGASFIGFPDDNITLKIDRFEALCDAIIKAGHDNVRYFVQGSSRGIASNETLVKKMSRAGFLICFLGIENVTERNLKFMKKGKIVDYSKRAIELCHKYNILVIGGLLLGNPDDREEDIAENYQFLRDNDVEYHSDQILSPFVGTPLRDEFSRQGLITNATDFRYYNGFWANTKTRHLSSDQLQFLKWKYHRMNSLLFRPEPKAAKRRLPLYSAYRQLIGLPIRRFKDRRRFRNATDYDLYREAMADAWRYNLFFDDKPPSTHVDVGLPETSRAAPFKPIPAREAGLI